MAAKRQPVVARIALQLRSGDRQTDIDFYWLKCDSPLERFTVQAHIPNRGG